MPAGAHALETSRSGRPALVARRKLNSCKSIPVGGAIERWFSDAPPWGIRTTNTLWPDPTDIARVTEPREVS